jgi:hypothetical protein
MRRFQVRISTFCFSKAILSSGNSGSRLSTLAKVSIIHSYSFPDYYIIIISSSSSSSDNLCGLVVRVPGYRSRGPDSIPGAARFSEK